jgi:hypothetical protein
MELGPVFSQLVQLLQIGHRGGVYYPRLFSDRQQDTVGFTENIIVPHTF